MKLKDFRNRSRNPVPIEPVILSGNMGSQSEGIVNVTIGSIEKGRRGKRKMRARIGKHGQQNQASRRVS